MVTAKTNHGFTLETEVLDEIRQRAKKEDRSMSSWIRQACIQKLQEKSR